MKISEAIGMISTGALLTIGATHFFASEDAPAPAATPVQALAGPEAKAPRPDGQVARAATDLTALDGTGAAMSRVDRINQIVALSQQPLKQEEKLSPMQREAIAFFERIARQQNEERSANVGQGLRFNNMAVDRLNVRYYYTVDVPFSTLDRGKLMREQEQLVVANLCKSEAIATLMKEYGFTYTYSYQTADGRFAGALSADEGACG